MITSNIKEIIKNLDDFEKRQLPYIKSLTLNNTAEIAMKLMSAKIKRDFNITSSWNKVGGKYGIKKQRATKRLPQVEIYIPTANEWIEDHEDGDERKDQLIPTKGFKQLFPTLRTNRSIKKKAQTLLSNKIKYRIFEAPLTIGDSVMAIFQRSKGKIEGKRQLRSKRVLKNKKAKAKLLKPKKVLRRDAIPLFIIKSSVKEKSRLGFYEIIPKIFDKHIANEFKKAYDFAMKTAKNR